MKSIDEVYEKLKERNIHEELEFDEEIDVESCPYLSGYRCKNNIHVEDDKRHAHIDYIDPVKDPVGHLEEDVGIKREIIYSAIGAAAGGVISTLVGDRDKQTQDAIKGAIAGAIIGALISMLAR